MREDDQAKSYLRSGEVSRLTGVSSDTLRHYERKGLLSRPRRSRNGYREYPASAIDRVRLVRQALCVGFTLDELVGVFQVRDRGGAPCRQVRALAEKKLAELETQLEQLTELRAELRRLLKKWDHLLAETPDSQRAGLLEQLVTIPLTMRAGFAVRSRNRKKGTHRGDIDV